MVRLDLTLSRKAMEKAVEEAKAAYKDMLAMYVTPEIPVANENPVPSLIRISAAFAALAFSTSDGVALEVKQDHVRLAKEFVEGAPELLEFEDYEIVHRYLFITEEVRKGYTPLS